MIGIKVHPNPRWFYEGREKGKELIVRRATKSQVTNRLTNGNHVIFLDKTVPTFVSRSVQLVRPCDNRDFHDPLPQLVTFPLFFSLGENKRKTEKVIHMDSVQSRLLCAAWKTFSGWFLWFTSIDNYLPTSSLSLKRKQNETLWSGIEVRPSPLWFYEGREGEGVTSKQSHHSQVIQSNLVKVHEPL